MFAFAETSAIIRECAAFANSEAVTIVPGSSQEAETEN
jgi:hypothetical protein